MGPFEKGNVKISTGQFDRNLRNKVLFDLILKLLLSSRVKDSKSLHRTFNVDPLYLQHENSGDVTNTNLFIICVHQEVLARSFFNI